MIEFSHVNKQYGTSENPTIALNDASFVVHKHEFVSLFGPSGCGKSTSMHIMGCLDIPTSGVCRLNGTDTTQLSQRQLAHVRNELIGFIFQQYLLLPRFTALQNVMLPLAYRAQPAPNAQQRAETILAEFGLGDHLHHYPNQLSGGQQQRVAISRALIGNPQIILADEPTGALDSKNTEYFIEQLLDIHKTKQTTVVLVTHNEELARRCQRIIHIKDGHIQHTSSKASTEA